MVRKLTYCSRIHVPRCACTMTRFMLLELQLFFLGLSFGLVSLLQVMLDRILFSFVFHLVLFLLLLDFFLFLLFFFLQLFLVIVLFFLSKKSTKYTATLARLGTALALRFWLGLIRRGSVASGTSNSGSSSSSASNSLGGPGLTRLGLGKLGLDRLRLDWLGLGELLGSGSRPRGSSSCCCARGLG